jgi:hypothetical protein
MTGIVKVQIQSTPCERVCVCVCAKSKYVQVLGDKMNEKFSVNTVLRHEQRHTRQSE